MNGYLISIVLILSLMGCALAIDFENGVEMRPGEIAAENLFNHGIGQPWVGGNPPSFNSVDYPSKAWGWGYDPFSYYDYQGKTYHPYRHFYYDYQGKTYDPYIYSNYYYPYIDQFPWYPHTYHNGYLWF